MERLQSGVWSFPWSIVSGAVCPIIRSLSCVAKAFGRVDLADDVISIFENENLSFAVEDVVWTDFQPCVTVFDERRAREGRIAVNEDDSRVNGADDRFQRRRIAKSQFNRLGLLFHGGDHSIPVFGKQARLK